MKFIIQQADLVKDCPAQKHGGFLHNVDQLGGNSVSMINPGSVNQIPQNSYRFYPSSIFIKGHGTYWMCCLQEYFNFTDCVWF
ncbi:MAG: hypothetical protein KKD28_09880 [Chloroflexi bacterium]|nr:hypothetical protein [Chloroflexota bacterium]MBU1661768.1 hypothetical protein [Chloroflexota bacterium]